MLIVLFHNQRIHSDQLLLGAPGWDQLLVLSGGLTCTRRCSAGRRPTPPVGPTAAPGPCYWRSDGRFWVCWGLPEPLQVQTHTGRVSVSAVRTSVVRGDMQRHTHTEEHHRCWVGGHRSSDLWDRLTWIFHQAIKPPEAFSFSKHQPASAQ